ncbi:hypothetical protein IFT77_03015 [Frigoribacterium sp. CFBP 13729]|uniref:hypothetical protein n=1 Tax=unclassified Frigoribacterium TaxID=2627005 RepID=UPI001782EE30|nr:MULTISPECIES: hypothetical protein [unclassified Frigoribacterium]MBD8584697.1 hypothetical protein [Frigoribacterium sp. CFBP 8766]MBD8609455.1 hypothetical protein [Frigoribacterium sp. CFBP 13729]
MTVPDTATTSSSPGAVVVPSPSPEPSRWVLSVAAALVAGLAVGGAGAARGDLDLLAVLLAGASVASAQGLAGLVGRQAARAARDRWFAALDETEAVCDARLDSRRRSLQHIWPTSADLVERLRRGEAPPVVGVRSLVVLGSGRVDSGIVLVGDTGAAVVRHARTEVLRRRLAELPDGPLCVDAAGGVHVRGPELLARSLAGGYRAQLRHRGAPDGLVTWQPAAADGHGDGEIGAAETEAEALSGQVGGGGGSGPSAACVVEISRHGAVAVVRRDGTACSVPVTPAWTSVLDAPDAADAPDAPDALDGRSRQRVTPQRP